MGEMTKQIRGSFGKLNFPNSSKGNKAAKTELAAPKIDKFKPKAYQKDKDAPRKSLSDFNTEQKASSKGQANYFTVNLALRKFSHTKTDFNQQKEFFEFLNNAFEDLYTESASKNKESSGAKKLEESFYLLAGTILSDMKSGNIPPESMAEARLVVVEAFGKCIALGRSFDYTPKGFNVGPLHTYIMNELKEILAEAQDKGDVDLAVNTLKLAQLIKTKTDPILADKSEPASLAEYKNLIKIAEETNNTELLEAATHLIEVLEKTNPIELRGSPSFMAMDVLKAQLSDPRFAKQVKMYL